jgi:hypothetical protein
VPLEATRAVWRDVLFATYRGIEASAGR